MARTPFSTRLRTQAAGGTVVYTVPPSKIVVCNVFAVATGFDYSPQECELVLNGVMSGALLFPFSNRFGPFVFNAGDVIGLQEGPTMVAGLIGFQHDQSTNKVPFNQILTAGVSSYTVPAGKYVVASCFIQVACSVAINGVPVAYMGMGSTGAQQSPGPITAASGSVITLVDDVPNLHAKAHLSGFLYNN